MYIGIGERAMDADGERLYTCIDPLVLAGLRAGGLRDAGVRAAPPGERAVGSSKSHATPCLVQLPHAGCSSSHCGTSKHCGVGEVRVRACAYLDLPLLTPHAPGSRLLV